MPGNPTSAAPTKGAQTVDPPGVPISSSFGFRTIVTLRSVISPKVSDAICSIGAAFHDGGDRGLRLSRGVADPWRVGGVFPCNYRPGPRSVLARPLHRTTIQVIATRPRAAGTDHQGF